MYVDLGATAFDAEDGDLSVNITTNLGGLDTTAPGVYRVTYTAMDSDGCVAVAVRYVRVIALVRTSDAAFLNTLCLSQVTPLRVLCEVVRSEHMRAQRFCVLR